MPHASVPIPPTPPPPPPPDPGTVPPADAPAETTVPRRRVLRRDARAKKLPTLTERGRVSSGLRAERYRRLGDALSAARIAAGIRQRDLARALRKPQSFVSKYERASRRLDVIEFLCVTSLIGASALEVLAAVMEAD